MSETTATRQRRLSPAVLNALLAIALTAGLGIGSVTGAPNATQRPALHLAAEDDEVILPGRVAAIIGRTLRSVDRAEANIDDGHNLAARRALRSVVENLRRAGRVAQLQLNAAPVDEEAETTPGPDSVVAILNLDQSVIVNLSGMYDGVRGRPYVVARLTSAMTVAHNQRWRLLGLVMGLDPEGAGADYADGMADTVDGYADEVAALTEALQHDRLTTTSRTALKTARSRSIATQTRVTAAFGGGE